MKTKIKPEAKKTKPIEIRKSFHHMSKAELEFLKTQFPEATPDDIDKVNRKVPIRYSHHITDGKGKTTQTIPIPKDKLFRTGAEGRTPVIMLKKQAVKLKSELWTSGQIIDLFRVNRIHADRTAGWFITFNTPSRKMTATDQLDLMLQHTDTEHEIHINHTHKHLVIEELNP